MRETFLSLTGLAELLLWRDGGQRQARRNAWAAMVTDANRARERADAAAAVARADRLAEATAATTGARDGDRAVPLAR